MDVAGSPAPCTAGASSRSNRQQEVEQSGPAITSTLRDVESDSKNSYHRGLYVWENLGFPLQFRVKFS